MHALLIVDDVDERGVLSSVLQRAGLVTTTDVDPRHAVDVWPTRPADMVVIAVEGDPLGTVRSLRGVARAPIAVVVDPIREKDHIQLLESGADMVVERPYSSLLLVSKLRALLRRSGGVPIFSLPTLSADGVSLDPSSRSVRVEDRPARHLTQLEFRLLYSLMVHHGQVLPSETVVEQVWGYSGSGNRDLVRGLVSRLRGKVEPDPHSPRYVRTVPGVGYCFGLEDAQ